MVGETSVTLKTIADDVGVSVTTVARALKDGDRIGAETVARVRAAAERLGYQRNLDAVKLRTGKTFIAMALLSFSNEEEVGDSGSVGLLNGIHHRFDGTEYAVRAIPVPMGETGLGRLKQVVASRNADGVILDHTEPQDARVKYLLEHDFPFVTFGRTELFSEHAWFDLDNEYAARQGTQSLIDAGHRRIALIDGEPRYTFVRQRLRGYRAALEAAGLPFDATLIRHIPLEPDLARDAARDLARTGVDAFVCGNELAFLGARAGVRAAGVPLDRVGFSLRSGTILGDYIGTSVHTSHFSRLEAGWNLADLLLKRIGGGDPVGCQLLARTDLRLSKGSAP